MDAMFIYKRALQARGALRAVRDIQRGVTAARAVK